MRAVSVDTCVSLARGLEKKRNCEKTGQKDTAGTNDKRVKPQPDLSIAR
jgi:hypothetical protein